MLKQPHVDEGLAEVSESELDALVESGDDITVSFGVGGIMGVVKHAFEKDAKRYEIVCLHGDTTAEIAGPFAPEDMRKIRKGEYCFIRQPGAKFFHAGASRSGEHFAIVRGYVDRKKKARG